MINEFDWLPHNWIRNNKQQSILTKNCEKNLFWHWITHAIVCCAHVAVKKSYTNLNFKIDDILPSSMRGSDVV